jgi:hypothetical protein
VGGSAKGPLAIPPLDPTHTHTESACEPGAQPQPTRPSAAAHTPLARLAFSMLTRRRCCVDWPHAAHPCPRRDWGGHGGWWFTSALGLWRGTKARRMAPSMI